MANRAFLYATDIVPDEAAHLSLWQEGVPYFDSRWTLPCAWYFLFQPRDLKSFHGTYRFVATRKEALALARSRADLFAAVGGGLPAKAMFLGFLRKLAGWQGDFLWLDAQSVVELDEEYDQCREVLARIANQDTPEKIRAAARAHCRFPTPERPEVNPIDTVGFCYADGVRAKRLTTARLFLRPFVFLDLPGVARLLSDPKVMRFSSGPYSLEQSEGWLADAVSKGQPWAVSDESGHLLGYCGLFALDNVNGRAEIELGYRLLPEHWGQGLASEAARAVVEDALVEQGIDRIISLIDPDNAASRRVAEKLGMRLEGQVMMPGYDHPDLVYAYLRTPT